jgi:hypothetical protein
MKKYLLLLGISLSLIYCQSAKQEPQSSEAANENANAMQPTNAVTDFLHVPGPITLSQKEHLLAWSSHPSDNYYKHEYLPKGENPERYDQMIMLEVALGDIIPLDIANAKANEIEGRKGTDALAEFTLAENKGTGELLLDFMMSEGTGDAAIVEWNCYRYKSYVGPSGQKGIMLFALSKRGYGAGGKTFAADCNSNREQYMNEFQSVAFPEIKI